MSLMPSDRSIRIDPRTSSTNRHFWVNMRITMETKFNGLANFPNVCESCR